MVVDEPWERNLSLASEVFPLIGFVEFNSFHFKNVNRFILTLGLKIIFHEFD